MIRTAIFWYAYVAAVIDGRNGDADFYGRLWAISQAAHWRLGKPNWMPRQMYNREMDILRHEGVL